MSSGAFDEEAIMSRVLLLLTNELKNVRKATAARCVEICTNAHSPGHWPCIKAIKKEFDL